MPSFFVQNFGCRATQADGAALEQDLARRGLARAGEARAADLVVLNTCTVTAAADEDARRAIRRLRRENPRCRILVTGCYAQRAPQELAALPGVAWVVGNSHKHQIGDIVARSGPSFPACGVGFPACGSSHSHPAQPFVPLSALRSGVGFPACDNPHADSNRFFVPLSSLWPPSTSAAGTAQIITGDIFAHTELLAAPVFGAGAERTRPNLKIQDGCNNRCSFCIIPAVRGRSRSLRPEAVLAQVREMERAGYREIVLSGINLGRYGRDLVPRLSFTGIVRAILQDTGVERIRLSSVEPMDFTDELLELMAGERRIARHVHAPLQSGSDRVLGRMRRRYRAAQYEARIRRAAALLPDAAFGADVMVGFPGETEEDFERTCALIERLPFTYLHVFTYSRRDGTPAATMPGQVDGRVARERNRILRELAARKNLEFRRRQVGRTLSVITLTDGTALSDNYLKVHLCGPTLAPNRILNTRITGLEGDHLVGTVESDPRA